MAVITSESLQEKARCHNEWQCLADTRIDAWPREVVLVVSSNINDPIVAKG